MTAPLAVTMGTPAGVGADLITALWARLRADLPPFVLIDDPDHVRLRAERLGLSVPVQQIEHPGEAADVFSTALPVLAQPLSGAVIPGQPDPGHAPATRLAIERAVGLALAGEVEGIVTLPLHKESLYAAGFSHPGHTEFLAELCGVSHDPVMMLAIPGLRVVPLTIHVPLASVAPLITEARLLHAARTTISALVQDFGVPAPRLAVAGLNPHAGEGGTLGPEERAIIAPAVEKLRAEGLGVSGPFPADTLFHAEARAAYDAVVCMYHDQALIPLKTLNFMEGVNITLGLPIVRTSPDHGTAFDLAGSGKADPSSLLAALHTAHQIAQNRAALA